MKCVSHVNVLATNVSRPARGAWIEIAPYRPEWERAAVAPRTGRVD